MSAKPPPLAAELSHGPDSTDEIERTREILVLRTGDSRRAVVPTLRVVAGRDMLRFVALEVDQDVVLGRDESVDLVLTDVSVSRRHATVRCMPDGSVRVTDLRSTNGTAINGLATSGGVLRPGDQLEVGAVSMRLDLLSPHEIAHLDSVLSRVRAANRDPLTGLLTRRWLDDELPGLMTRASSAGLPFSCAFIDLDHFKVINDTHTHSVGDEVLQGVSRLLLLGVRDSDACIRYGGEELLLFLLGNDEEAAYEVVERVRKAIAGHDWSRTAPNLRVSISFGVAEWDGLSPAATWLKRADVAMYRAKSTGRDRGVRSSLGA